jgi:hypothetical protein
VKILRPTHWKVKIHGKGKRRTRRKLHIGIDADTQDIVMHEMTGNDAGDGEVDTVLVKDLPEYCFY